MKNSACRYSSVSMRLLLVNGAVDEEKSNDDMSHGSKVLLEVILT